MKHKLIVAMVSIICITLLVVPNSSETIKDNKEATTENNFIKETNSKQQNINNEETGIEDGINSEESNEVIESEEIDNNSSDETSAVTNNKKSNDTSKKQNNNSTTNTSSKTNNQSNTKPVEQPKEKTTKEKNDDLITQIYNTYGFKVDYGEGTYCWYDYKSCTVLYDEEKANTALTTLLTGLNIFPQNFFRTFQGNNGYRIDLFENIPGDVSGLASYEMPGDNRILLDVNQGFLNRLFYHETWHIMEKYIEDNNVWSGWTSLNPSGFIYEQNPDDSYTVTECIPKQQGFNYVTVCNKPTNQIAFISVYAKTNERDDRAELFADLMFRAYKKDYMNSGFGVNEKAKYMANVIRQYFPNSVGAHWERFISW